MPDFFNIIPSNLDLKKIKKIALKINNGALAIYPTDTVYALGCLSTSLKPLKKLAKIKNIKLEKAAFSFMFKDIRELSLYVKPFDNKTYRLLNKTLPGPYTYIMKSSKKFDKPFHKKKTIGFRISNNIVVKTLLTMLDAPLITTSLHDKDEIIDYTSDPKIIFEEWFDKIDLMIDGGFCGNIPSTIVDLTKEDINVLREGKGSLKYINKKTP